VTDGLLAHCTFPAATSVVSLAVSGGPDSMGLLLLALDAALVPTVHHVNHHARPTSDDDAAFVRSFCELAGLVCVVHDVSVAPGPNFESRARTARRAVLPLGVLTGHTMDDLAETILLNQLRGAGIDGTTPMVGDPTKPLLGVRRDELHDYVTRRGVVARIDETNASPEYRRNRVRHELLPLMNEIMERDVVPVLARNAEVLFDDRQWLDALSAIDASMGLAEADCRTLRTWPPARLHRWLRVVLRSANGEGDAYAPSADELARAVAVVRGEVVACELRGGRRLARRDQHLTLEE